jgi:hypothetical protein
MQNCIKIGLVGLVGLGQLVQTDINEFIRIFVMKKLKKCLPKRKLLKIYHHMY